MVVHELKWLVIFIGNAFFLLRELLFYVEGPGVLDYEYFPPRIFAITFARAL